MSALDKFFDPMLPTIAALADWKTPAHGLIKYVVERGHTYTFSASSTATPNGTAIVAATDGTTGNWLEDADTGAGVSTDARQSVRFMCPSNDTLTGLAARDGVTPVAGDRAFAPLQTTQSQRGIYVASSGAWTRATDANESAEMTCGLQVYVEEGTIFKKTSWRLTTANPIVLDTTSLSFLMDPGVPVTNVSIARSGELRLNAFSSTSGGVRSRTADDANDFRVIANDSNGGILVGDTTAISVTHNVATSGFHAFQVNSVETGRFITGALQLGATPAQSGIIRIPNAQVIRWRHTGAADIDGLQIDGSNNVIVGESTNVNDAYVKASTTFRVHLNASDRVTVTTSLVNVKVVACEFDGQYSSAVNSQAFTATPTFDFNLGNNHAMAAATANITAVTLSNPRSGAIYTIMCTQDGTGTRTITWPAATRFEGTDNVFGATANNVTVWTFLYDGTVHRCISRKVYAT